MERKDLIKQIHGFNRLIKACQNKIDGNNKLIEMYRAEIELIKDKLKD